MSLETGEKIAGMSEVNVEGSSAWAPAPLAMRMPGVETGKENFFDLRIEDLSVYLQKLGKEKFRSQQIFQWVYQKNTLDPQAMTNLSKEVRDWLPTVLDFKLPRIVQDLTSVDGTRKFLFDVGGGKTVESVLIPNGERLTLCVSSEVGCNIGCKFCFTAKQKLSRRLTAGEIVGQFWGATRALPAGRRITNIVFMGMGEPLDNPDAVFRSIDILCDTWGFNFSRRKITVSTSGLVPMIPRVAEARVRLAVSLNASSEEIRSQVMPINKAYPMKMLLDACHAYAHQTGDRVTFEYVLLKGVTDSLEDARRLRQITLGIPSKINIIPFNEHPGSDFQRPSPERVREFQEECIRLGMHVLLRKTMGRDIYAACGQLRSKFEGHPERMSVL